MDTLLDEMHAWLQGNGDDAHHADGRNIKGDISAYCFRHAACANRFFTALDIEQEDRTNCITNRSSALHYGKRLEQLHQDHQRPKRTEG